MCPSFWKNECLLRILFVAQAKYNNHYTSSTVALLKSEMQCDRHERQFTLKDVEKGAAE